MAMPQLSEPIGAGAPPAEATRKRMSKWRLYTRRYMRNRPAVAGAAIFVLIVLFAAIGQLFAQWTHTELDFLSLSDPPSPEHWFGTTAAGNDVYAQVVTGLQRSLMISITVSVGVTVLSAVIGTTAAYFGGAYERIMLGLIHFLMVIPTFLLLAMLSNDSGGDWRVIAAVMIVASWFLPARVIWTLSLSMREREYVFAAKYMGVHGFTTVMRHILPNIGSLLVINFTLGIVSAVQTETGLSFIGFGVKAPDVSLGSMIGSGATSMSSSPWLFYFPAAVLTLVTVSMALVADGLRDALDPTSAAGGRA